MEKSSTQRFQTICIFRGSSFGKDPEFIRVAWNLGKLLLTRKIKLVYGENSGLMECAVKSALSSQGKVLGIIPKDLPDMNPEGPTLSDVIKVPSIHEQIPTMLYNADPFIALPGGTKTFEEIFCIISWAQLNMHKKLVGMLSVNGFYDGLCHFINHCFHQEFIKVMTHPTIIAARTVEGLIDQMEANAAKLDPLLSNQEIGGSSSNEHGIDTILKF